MQWQNDGGFGFIKTDGGQEIFVHCRDVQNADGLQNGDRVEFQIAVNLRETGKNRAVRVIKIGDAPWGPPQKKTDLKKISKTDNKVTMKGNGTKGAQKMKGGAGKSKLKKPKRRRARRKRKKKKVVKSAGLGARS